MAWGQGKLAWNKGKITWKKCKGCSGKTRKWLVYCSKACMLKYKDMAKPVVDYVKKNGAWNKGKKMNEEYRKKCSERQKLIWKNDKPKMIKSLKKVHKLEENKWLGKD